jgi:hypothetical protein
MLLVSKHVVGCVVDMLMDFKSRNGYGETDMNKCGYLRNGMGKTLSRRYKIPGYTLYKEIYSHIYIIYYYILYIVRCKMEDLA